MYTLNVKMSKGSLFCILIDDLRYLNTGAAALQVFGN